MTIFHDRLPLQVFLSPVICYLRSILGQQCYINFFFNSSLTFVIFLYIFVSCVQLSSFLPHSINLQREKMQDRRNQSRSILAKKKRKKVIHRRNFKRNERIETLKNKISNFYKIISNVTTITLMNNSNVTVYSF